MLPNLNSFGAEEDVLPLQPNIKGYFRVQRFCFAFIGINPTSLDHTYFNLFLVTIPVLSLLTLSFIIFYFAIENISDLNKVTDILSPFWQGILSILKLIFFIWNRKKFVILIRKLWLWNLKAKGKEYFIVSSENRKDVIFCNFYHMAVACTGVLALLAPLLIAGYHSLHGELFWDYLDAPLKAFYFFNIRTSSGYILAFSWNFIAIYYIIYGSVAIDSLFSWFLCNIVAQFRILKYRSQKAGQEDNGNCSMESLNACIMYHYHTIELANEFNEVFSGIVFVKFAISCIQICCLAFQFSQGGELVEQMFHGLFLLAVSMQMILYCYGGQRIQDESTSIAGEIYESFHWDSLSSKSKKILILLILRSQRASHISGIFFTANLSLYLWVYRTAASFITMLWTLAEKAEEEETIY